MFILEFHKYTSHHMQPCHVFINSCIICYSVSNIVLTIKVIKFTDRLYILQECQKVQEYNR